MAATVVTLNDLEGHSSVAGLFKCNPSNICAAFYTISTDSWSHGSSALAELLVLSRPNHGTIYIAFVRRSEDGQGTQR